MRPWAQWTAKTALLAAGFAAAGGGTASGGAAGVIQRAVSPVTSVLGATGPAGTGSFRTGPLAGLQQVSGLAPLETTPAPRGIAGAGADSTFGNPSGAAGADDTNVPAHPNWPDSGPCRAARTCRRWPVWPTRPPRTV